jgi:hypothetical protein
MRLANGTTPANPSGGDLWIRWSNFRVLDHDVFVYDFERKKGDLFGVNYGVTISISSHDPAFPIVKSWIDECNNTLLQEQYTDYHRFIDDVKVDDCQLVPM